MAIKKKQTPVEDYTPQRLLELWLSIVKAVKCKGSKELCHALNSLKPSHVDEIFLLLESNKNVLVEVLKEYPRYLAFMPPSIRDDLDIVMLACKENPISIEKASLRIRDLQEVAEWSTQVKPPLLHLMSHRWSRDLELQKKALRTHPFYIRQLIRYKGSKDNKELIKAAVRIHGYYLAYASDELKKDAELACIAIITDGKLSSRLQINENTLFSPEVLPTVISRDIPWLLNNLLKCSKDQVSKRLLHLENVMKNMPEATLLNGFELLKEKPLFIPSTEEASVVLEALLKHVDINFVTKVKEMFPLSKEFYPDDLTIFDEIIASKKLLAIKKDGSPSIKPSIKRRILKP